jgi:hypothetical protein
VLDIRLGTDSGLRLLSDAANQGRARLPAVIVLTAYDYPQYAEAASNLGAAGFVGAPAVRGGALLERPRLDGLGVLGVGAASRAARTSGVSWTIVGSDGSTPIGCGGVNSPVCGSGVGGIAGGGRQGAFAPTRSSDSVGTVRANGFDPPPPEGD